jgi:hypothetical protein
MPAQITREVRARLSTGVPRVAHAAACGGGEKPYLPRFAGRARKRVPAKVGRLGAEIAGWTRRFTSKLCAWPWERKREDFHRVGAPMMGRMQRQACRNSAVLRSTPSLLSTPDSWAVTSAKALIPEIVSLDSLAR